MKNFNNIFCFSSKAFLILLKLLIFELTVLKTSNICVSHLHLVLNYGQRLILGV